MAARAGGNLAGRHRGGWPGGRPAVRVGDRVPCACRRDRRGRRGTSTEVSATPATTPGSPSGLTVTAGHSLVTLSWTAPASDGGSALTRYRVYDGTTAGFQDGTAATTSTGTSATVTRLTDGTTYYFRVAAVNAVGEGPASVEASTTLAAVRVPGPPTRLTATAGGSR